MAFPYTAELEQDGFVFLSGIASGDQIDDFWSEVEALANFHLKRKGQRVVSGKALPDLLQMGGEFRKLLFPNLKSLPAVQTIALEGEHKMTEMEFQKALGMRFPIINWSVKADLPGEQRFLLPMHQDYKTPCHRAYRLWIPMRDACERFGTMKYVPGSHRNGYTVHDDSDPSLPSVPDEAYDASTVEVLEMPAGDGFLFNPLLYHASVAATKSVVKAAIIVNFWDLATIADPEDGDDPIPSRLAVGSARDSTRDN